MAKDLYHDTVRTALIKDGWTIIKDEYRLRIDDDLLFLIDVLAEKYLIAQKEKSLILVEVKSFIRQSETNEFHTAIGQYITYQTALEYLQMDISLYLAIPEVKFNHLFQKPFIQYLIKKFKVQLMPFDIEKKILVK